MPGLQHGNRHAWPGDRGCHQGARPRDHEGARRHRPRQRDQSLLRGRQEVTGGGPCTPPATDGFGGPGAGCGSMVAVESLSYVILYVRDLEASAAFYRDVVGLLIKLRDAGYAEFVTGQTRFGLLERTRASALIRREPAQGGPAGEVLFLVDDIDAEAERLRTLHLLDPDGFVVELAQKIPRLLPRHG